MALTVGVDVGGTKVSAVLVNDAGRVVARKQRATANNAYDALMDAIVGSVEHVTGGRAPDAVGLAIAGNVAADGSSVAFSAHLPLAGEPIRDDLSSRLGLPVTVDNDANAATWAEYRFGAAQRAEDVLMVTVGTGLGSGLVLSEHLYRGSLGFAGEVGHVTVVRDGRDCPCGARGCWERYASGTALLLAFRERGGDPALDGPGVTAAAVAGDQIARNAFAEIGDWLGQGLASMVAVVDPGIVVIGGGVSDAGELLMARARQTFSESLTGGGRRAEPPIVQAGLGIDAGVIGAATISRERHT